MKNGFTLIELLTTIVIIGILGAITIPVISGTIKNSKERALEETKNNILDAANSYILENDFEYSTDSKFIDINTLKQKGYLPNKTYTDPVTGDELKGCVLYRWVEENKGYLLSWQDSCS